jgi:hypothetical protein
MQVPLGCIAVHAINTGSEEAELVPDAGFADFSDRWYQTQRSYTPRLLRVWFNLNAIGCIAS